MKKRLIAAVLATILVGILPGIVVADDGGTPNDSSCAGQYLAFYAQLNPGIPLGQLIPGPAKGHAVVEDIRASVCAP